MPLLSRRPWDEERQMEVERLHIKQLKKMSVTRNKFAFTGASSMTRLNLP
jgi:hypothetical protein